MKNKTLRVAIVERFDSQSAFAKAAGVHPSRVSQVVQGRFNLTPDEKDHWLKVLCWTGSTEELFDQ